jgi:hypothetical protein
MVQTTCSAEVIQHKKCMKTKRKTFLPTTQHKSMNKHILLATSLLCCGLHHYCGDGKDSNNGCKYRHILYTGNVHSMIIIMLPCLSVMCKLCSSRTSVSLCLRCYAFKFILRLPCASRMMAMVCVEVGIVVLDMDI